MSEGTEATKKPQGFAKLKLTDPERFRAICSAGGKAAIANETTHRFTSEEAREAGRKGGKATAAKRTAELAGRGES